MSWIATTKIRRGGPATSAWPQALHIDLPLLLSLAALATIGLVVLYSAGNQDIDVVARQATRLAIAFLVMVVVAQIPPRYIKSWTPWLFGLGTILLVAVLYAGAGKGAQRWLDLGVLRFQPSELMKIAVPMMVAWLFADAAFPPSKRRLLVAAILIAVPTILIAKQPDLGTALLIACAGGFVILLAGISWRLVASIGLLLLAATPLLWFVMHDYQRRRVLTFFNPENDPLGSGWHIVQSKIAIGSGGTYGKGWLNGTQSHLEFLPERSTDFIFAVLGEEFGLIGVLGLLLIYLIIVMRGLYIAVHGQGTFSRLLGGSLIMTFFITFFINVGMVTGLLPVVGLPLPMISYGGSSMVTMMAAFGILMSIHTHRKLF